MVVKKYETLDGLRTFACIGIVLMHICANANYVVEGFFFDKLIPLFTNFVFLFMIISGFGMCCGYYNRILSGKIDFIVFYKKRYKKILPFFAFLCFIDFIFSPSLQSLYEVMANLTLCFGLIPNANISVIGVGWFLGVVFAFYLLFPFYCFLISTKTRAWVTFIVSFIMNYLCSVYFKVGRTSIVYCFVYFVAGGLIYLYRTQIEKTAIKWISLATMVMSCVVCIFGGESSFVLLLLNSSILVFAVCINDSKILNNAVNKFIGSLSFEIYLCHMVIYRVVEKLHLLNLFENDYINYLFVSVLIFTGAICFAYTWQICTNKMLRWVEENKASR